MVEVFRISFENDAYVVALQIWQRERMDGSQTIFFFSFSVERVELQRCTKKISIADEFH